MKSTEKATQAAILDYLSLRKHFHYRQNSGAFKTERGGFYRMAVSGAPDIVCVPRDGELHGRYVAIEVKDVKGRLNSNQEKFRDDLQRAGGVYIVARSLDDVTAVL